MVREEVREWEGLDLLFSNNWLLRELIPHSETSIAAFTRVVLTQSPATRSHLLKAPPHFFLSNLLPVYLFFNCFIICMCSAPKCFNHFTLFFYCFVIHTCIQGLGHFSPLPPPPPLPPTPPLPLPPTPSIPSRNYFALISNFVVERV
jgi:hypothetical protein